MSKLTQKSEEKLIERLDNYVDTEKFKVLEKYLKNNPYATDQDLRDEGFSSLLSVVENRSKLLKEYLGITTQKTVYRKKELKCKPSSRKRNNQTELECRDVQLLSDKSSTQNLQPANLRRTTYQESELRSIILEMRKGSTLDEIAEKLRREKNDLARAIIYIADKGLASSNLISNYYFRHQEELREYLQEQASSPNVELRVISEKERDNKPKVKSKKRKSLIERIEETVKKDLKNSTKPRTYKSERSEKTKSYNHMPKKLMDSVIEIVSDTLSASKDNISPHTHIINDLGADELDIADLYDALEEGYNIKIREDQLDTFDVSLDTIGDLAEYIMKKKENKDSVVIETSEDNEIEEGSPKDVLE